MRQPVGTNYLLSTESDDKGESSFNLPDRRELIPPLQCIHPAFGRSKIFETEFSHCNLLAATRMVKVIHSLLTFSTLFNVALSSSSSGCARPLLQSALDGLFATIEGKAVTSTIKLDANFKITQNLLPKTTLQDTLLKNFTSWAKPFRITVLDEETCNVAAMSLPKVLNNETRLLSTRMKIDPVSGAATELEIYSAGSDTFMVFLGDWLPDNPGEIWAAKDPSPREALLKSMDAYPTAITAGNGSLVSVSQNPPCTRYENGFKIAPPFGTCNSGFKLIQVPVVARRWYIDSQTGVGLGNFVFQPVMWLHEYFKVRNGEIMQIYAGMVQVKNYKDPWV